MNEFLKRVILMNWCPGPESNRHGAKLRGIFLPATVFTAAFNNAFVVWTFSLPYRT